MPWLWSALMPHPPVLIPEVGRGRENEAAKTLEGAEKIISALKNLKPDVLFVLSPHQPYYPGAMFVNGADFYSGSFAVFGVPNVKINPVSSEGIRKKFCSCLSDSGINIFSKPLPDLTGDQGTLVPLYFLQKAWGELPPVVIASPIGLTPEQALKAGEILAEIQDADKFALLSSGDLSHRLTPDAPAGYAPEDAPVFEAAIEDAIKNISPDKIFSLTAKTIEHAGECGLRSVMAMLGLVKKFSGKIKIFSHEWPFGVGYCNALWINDNSKPAPVMLARETVKRLLEGRELPENGSEVVISELWQEKRACFVSIKTKSGELRGCIGTLSPLQKSLDLEIIANAISASTRDPRFPPMRKNELDNVIFSVDVLSEPERISGIEQLDPKKFGVIVSKGYQRGVLLPDLEGVDTAEQQVEIAAMKAGLYSTEGAKFERFTVVRYKEI